MGTKLFKSGCRVELIQGEPECLEIDVDALQYRPIEEVAPYYQDFSELLELYPVFTLELPFTDGLLFEAEDRVLFIENDGYLAVLKQANRDITSYVMGVLEENWTIITSIRLREAYESYNLLYLNDMYRVFNGKVDDSSWEFFGLKWGDADLHWADAINRREYLYREGDTFVVISPCQEAMYLYLVVQDVDSDSYTGFNSAKDKWRKVASITTGFNKCLGYKRRKHPTDLYKIVQIGSASDFVEAPIRYEPPQPVY